MKSTTLKIIKTGLITVISLSLAVGCTVKTKTAPIYYSKKSTSSSYASNQNSGSSSSSTKQTSSSNKSNGNAEALGFALGAAIIGSWIGTSIKNTNLSSSGYSSSSSSSSSSKSSNAQSSNGWNLVEKYTGGVSDFGLASPRTVYVVQCNKDNSKHKIYVSDRGKWVVASWGFGISDSSFEGAASKACK